MNIIGEKVLLRAIEITDKDVLLDIINDGETEHSLGGWSFPISSSTQEEWIKSQRTKLDTLRCMVSDKESQQTLGTAILSNIDYKNGNAEIHIKLISGARGSGYGTDTINTLVRYALDELRLVCVYAHVNDYNYASQMLFEKCGFVKEGILRKRIFKKGEFHDVITFSIIKEV